MNEEKQQKFTAKVRRGLVWVHSVAAAELAKKKAEATGVRIEGFTASELADVESALTWIGQNKESQGASSTAPATQAALAEDSLWVASPNRDGRAADCCRSDCAKLIEWSANALWSSMTPNPPVSS